MHLAGSQDDISDSFFGSECPESNATVAQRQDAIRFWLSEAWMDAGDVVVWDGIRYIVGEEDKMDKHEKKKLELDRISPEALEVNQKIVKALQAALIEYKGVDLTARFVHALKKHLPDSDFNVWMSKDKFFNGWYRINIQPVNMADFYADPQATFRGEREGKDFYAVRLQDTICAREDWRDQFQFIIDRFNDLDSYEWQQNREPYLEQFARLDQEANEIKAKAEALLASIPRPEHDPLGRYNHITDYELYRAFPAAFQYKR